MWITFASPDFREMKGEYWEEAALHCLAQFRAGYGRHIEDAWWSEQITMLSGISPEFKEIWNRQEVVYAPQGRKLICHPVEGNMIFEYLAFQAVDSPELQMVLNTPARDTDTSEKVKRLLSKDQVGQ